MRWCNRLSDVLMQSQHPTPTVPGGSAQTAAKRPPATPPCHTSVRPGLPSFLASPSFIPRRLKTVRRTAFACLPLLTLSLSPFLSEFLVCPAASAAAIQVIHPSMGWLPGGGLCAGIVARGSHVVKDISQSMPDLRFVLAPVSCNKKSD